MAPTKWHIDIKPGADATSAAYDPVNNLLILANPQFDYMTVYEPQLNYNGKQNKLAGGEDEIDLSRYPKRHVVVVDHVANRLVLMGNTGFDVVTLSSMKSHLTVPYDSTTVTQSNLAAYDERNNRIVTALNLQLVSFSAATGELLYQSKDFVRFTPKAVCIDNQGRVLMLVTKSFHDCLLCAYSPELRLIAQQPLNTDCIIAQRGTSVTNYDVIPQAGIAFDSLRGNIGIVICDDKPCCCWVIPANTLLPRTYEWSANKHCYAPKEIREVVQEIANIRSLVPESPLTAMPNELLFLIFEHL